jgi:hypothetical protein
MRYALIGFFVGLVISAGAYAAERTTGEIAWALVVSFPVFFTLAGWLYGRFAGAPYWEAK